LPDILHAACNTAATLASVSQGVAPFVSVNVDPEQLTSHPMMEMIRGSLVSTGTPPELLVIEVTERTDTFNDSSSLAVVHELSGLGVQFAIDDFGTGHSSLDRLKRLPASKVKIDRMFVRDVVDDQEDQVIVGSVAQLADGLGLECVAEGIQASDQAATVAGLGCTSGQGFLWSQAVSAAEIEQQVSDHVSWL
jgi:EAL domain-containing protein (putative c-di-GMP-specific phosphodiesterase class I)